MKVVGIGLNKTGTKTLGDCLKAWGLRHLSFSAEAFDQWVRGDVEAVLALAAGHDSFEDWPWPLLYRELDQRFPGSRFILTRRRSAQVWFDSICGHAERTGPTRFRERVYGHAMPQGHAERYIAVYDAHLQAVRRHFADRPGDLLEVCWEEGDGWERLGAFLGRTPPPGMPFPHKNKAPAR